MAYASRSLVTALLPGCLNIWLCHCLMWIEPSALESEATAALSITALQHGRPFLTAACTGCLKRGPRRAVRAAKGPVWEMSRHVPGVDVVYGARSQAQGA